MRGRDAFALFALVIFVILFLENIATALSDEFILVVFKVFVAFAITLLGPISFFNKNKQLGNSIAWVIIFGGGLFAFGAMLALTARLDVFDSVPFFGRFDIEHIIARRWMEILGISIFCVGWAFFIPAYVKQKSAAMQKAKDALEKKAADLLETQRRMEEYSKRRSELFNVSSHEMKGIITPVKGYSTLLLEAKLGALNEKQRGALEIISKSADQLSELAGKILHLAKLESGKTEFKFVAADIGKIVNDSIKMEKDFAQLKHISITANLQKKRPLARADVTELTQLVSELIHNAIKFTDDGGKVVVKAIAENNEIVVSVSDTGKGMEKEALQRLFDESFKPTDSKDGYISTGFGLKICRKIVEIHHGRIWATAEPGLGSTFYFSLPIKK